MKFSEYIHDHLTGKSYIDHEVFKVVTETDKRTGKVKKEFKPILKWSSIGDVVSVMCKIDDFWIDDPTYDKIHEHWEKHHKKQ